MILKYKKALILSSLACLLPIPVGMALWKLFPDSAITGTWIAMVPLTMLGAQWLCILASALDKSNQNKNEKIHKLILWLIPFLTWTLSGMMYALQLGLDFSPAVWMMVSMGLMFAGIGNYMPKTRMNATMGIKIRWTYSSEANWNATHRLAGKLWVVCGLLTVLGGFLPLAVGIALMMICFAVMILVPIVYSYRFYQKEKAEGKELKSDFPTMNPLAKKISISLVAVLLVFVALLMFTGEIRFRMDDTALTVEADWYSDLTVSYDSIDAIEYREGNIPGIRVGGFGSAKLLMGFFQNDELGIYTRYTPTDCESCILITRGGKFLVLSTGSAEGTRVLYNDLLEKINETKPGRVAVTRPGPYLLDKLYVTDVQ